MELEEAGNKITLDLKRGTILSATIIDTTAPTIVIIARCLKCLMKNSIKSGDSNLNELLLFSIITDCLRFYRYIIMKNKFLNCFNNEIGFLSFLNK